MNKPARFTQAEVERAFRAAAKFGLGVTATRIEPDGSVTLIHTPLDQFLAPAPADAPEGEDAWDRAVGEQP